MVDVTVVRSGEYDGRHVEPGEVLRMRPIDAIALARTGLISVSKHPTLRDAPKRSRRTYRRRDLQAEP